MIATHSANRWHRIAAALGVLLVAASCASRPSLGPKTETGQPAHVDAGPGQLLRYCETLHDRGKLPMAAAMCERAYQLDPTDPEPLLELASILGEMGEIELAKQAYNAILTDLPSHAEAHYGLGRIHLSAGQHDLALAEFQAGLRSDPTDPRLYNAAGVASGMLGAHVAAQEVFRAGLKVAPDDMRLRNNLGLSLIQSGHYDDGVKMLQAVANDPAAEQANRENLNLALGVAAAARAEAVLAANLARMEAESMAQAEALDQAAPVAEPAPMASEGAMGGDDVTEIAMGQSDDAEDALAENDATEDAMAESDVTEDAFAESDATDDALAESDATEDAMAESDVTEMFAEPRPAENLAAPGAAQIDGPTLTDETTPVEIPEPTPLLSTLITESASTERTTPSEPAKVADDNPSPPIPSWVQRAHSDISDVTDSDVGDRPDATNQEADARTLDEIMAEVIDDALAEPIAESVADASDAAMAGQIAALSEPPAPATTSDADHAVQLASYTSEDRAWRGWSLFQEDAADILGDVKPTVREANLGGAQGVVYRLRTAPSGKAEAQRLCDDLKPRGIACLVVKSEARPGEGDAPTGAVAP